MTADQRQILVSMAEGLYSQLITEWSVMKAQAEASLERAETLKHLADTARDLASVLRDDGQPT